MKAAAGIVVALVVGCGIGYGVALKLPKASQGAVTSGAPTDTSGPIFEYDGKKFSEADLPSDVQTSIYEFRKENVHRIDSVVSQYAMRMDLARQAGRDEEVPLPALEDLVNAGKPSEEEITELYEANKDRLPPGTTFEQIRPDIEKYMVNQKVAEVMQAKSAEFKASNKYNFLIEHPLAPIVAIDTSKFPVVGNKDSKIVVVEVADYLCPHCQMVQTEVEEVITEMGSTIRFSPVAFSVRPEGLSGQLARGAHCAFKQGDDKFWAWHKSAFSMAKTKGWKMTDPESMDYVKEILATIELDNTVFEQCVDSDEAKTAVADMIKSINALGVSGTPTFFVNGRRLDMHGGRLKDELQKHLKASSH